MKYFTCPEPDTIEDDLVYTLDQFIDIREPGETIILHEQKRDIGGVMWCKENLWFVDDECGLDCIYYRPCNDKSGRCRHLVNGFTETSRKFVLNDEGLKLKE